MSLFIVIIIIGVVLMCYNPKSIELMHQPITSWSNLKKMYKDPRNLLKNNNQFFFLIILPSVYMSCNQARTLRMYPKVLFQSIVKITASVFQRNFSVH